MSSVPGRTVSSLKAWAAGAAGGGQGAEGVHLILAAAIKMLNVGRPLVPLIPHGNLDLKASKQLAGSVPRGVGIGRPVDQEVRTQARSAGWIPRWDVQEAAGHDSHH